MAESDEAKVLAWLKREYAQPFRGWDFSHLRNRRIPRGSLLWNYHDVVLPYLSSASSLLDIDTGGAEALIELLDRSRFRGRVESTEGYLPNVQVARERLAAHDVVVHDTSAAPAVFPDASFDVVISRHGGSMLPCEIHRVLKPEGWFITEQIGDRTNLELRALFNVDESFDDRWPHNADNALSTFENLGFEVARCREHNHAVRFMDVGALVYYLKAVPWEVPEFEIERYADELLRLQQRSIEQGFAIDATYHVYLIVAQKL